MKMYITLFLKGKWDTEVVFEVRDDTVAGIQGVIYAVNGLRASPRSELYKNVETSNCTYSPGKNH